MPQDFWAKIGAIASTVVNTLISVGQMIYKGLVALGTFLVNLAQAIADWGMRALGAVWNAAVAVAQKVGEALQQLGQWIISFIVDGIKIAFNALFNAFTSSSQPTTNSVKLQASALAQAPPAGDSQQRIASALATTIMTSAVLTILMAVIGAISVVWLATSPMHGIVTQLAKIVGSTIVTVLVMQLVVSLLQTVVDPNQAITALLPRETTTVGSLGFAIADLALIVGGYIRQLMQPMKSLAKWLPVAMMYFIFSIWLLALSATVMAQGASRVNCLASVLIDAIAVFISFYALTDRDYDLHPSFKQWYGLFVVVSDLSGIASLALGLYDLGTDTVSLLRT